MVQQDFQEHLSYVKNAARERYLIDGGFLNIDGQKSTCH